MKEILKQAFDKANDIVTEYERGQRTLKEKVDGLNALCEETQTKVKNISANSCVIERIRSMKDDSGREGCTYGDTEYDSVSAVYGYNLAIENIVEELSKK